jgi:hypothetical protein
MSYRLVAWRARQAGDWERITHEHERHLRGFETAAPSASSERELEKSFELRSPTRTTHAESNLS